MGKSKRTIPLFLTFSLIVVFLTIFAGASLMGENHRINEVLSERFKRFKTEDFSAPCFPIAVDSHLVNIDEPGTCNNQNFLLYISLLKRFDLMDGSAYTLKIKRNNFWIPFLFSDEVGVSIRLQKEDENNWFSFDWLPFVEKPEEHDIDGLFVMGRDHWKWTINDVVINDAKLQQIFTEYEQTVDFNKYIEKVGSRYEFKNGVVDSESASDFDKRLLRFNLQKVTEFLK
ncbi:hypothetical protein VSAK1_15552 [Vibrio mediterranei AK1]|uniref:hypothetical protein n=1 Tax=Vibrio mediterranei TaxID=689 RepID=UPI0001541FE9|nr:hypothetical protein [Vibrio mediterranei]EDL52419.1 hypothetical protein VSAK1_15552 [Vibrio mediterranei AK1]